MSDGDRLAKPGELRYRAGTYRTFLAGMQRGARRTPPLATLNIEIASDFTNALISGWAQVCDVLTFYQERIANEGYLPTATEPVSVVYLTAQIGERRKPAVGAQTHLALQLIDAAGKPDSLMIEPGPCVVVQNAPSTPGTLPVVFECGERIELRRTWNALPLVIAPVPLTPALWPGCRSLRLVGTAAGIRSGSALLLTVADGPSWLVIVDTVQVDRSLGCTLVTWRTPVSAPPGWRSTVTGVTQFASTAGLFGRIAMEWSDVPEKQKEAIGVRAGGVMTADWSGLTPNSGTAGPALWTQPANAMPPPANIQALLGLEGDGLLAGTDRGLFRSTDGGATWQTLTLPQPRGWHDILSLHRDQSGTLYAGTAAGVVLTSGDGGDGWAMLTQTVTPRPDGKQGRFVNILEDLRFRERAKGAKKWTLLSPIRAILTQPTGAGGIMDIYIGTDQGVFAMLGNAPGWQPFGLAGVPVAALAVMPVPPDPPTLLAATNAGLFYAVLPEGGFGEPVSSGLPIGTVECTSLVVVNLIQVLIGTSAGVFLMPALTAKWEPFSDGLGPLPPPVTSLMMFAGSLCAATGAGFFTRNMGVAQPAEAPPWVSLQTQDLVLFEIDKVFADGLDAGKVPPALSQRFERFGIELDPDLVVRRIFVPDSSPPAQIGWELCKVQPKGQSTEQPPVPLFRIYAETPLRVTQLVTNQAGPGDRLAVIGYDTLVASVALGPVLNNEWPDFAIATGEVMGDAPAEGAEIYLDRKVDGIEPGSQIVLAPAGTSFEPLPEVHNVLATDAVLHKAFGKQGTVTRIIVAPTAELLAADLRSTNVYLASRPVAPFTATMSNLRPLAGNLLTLPGVQGGLAPGRSLQVSGPRSGAVVVTPPKTSDIAGQQRPVARAGADAGPALDQRMISPGLKDAFLAAGIKLSPSPDVSVVAPGARWLIRDGDQAWELDLPAEAEGALPLRIFAATLYEVVAQAETPGQSWTLVCGDETVTVPYAEGEVVRAASGQVSLSEIVTVHEVAFNLEANITEVTLTAPLSNLYDPALCRICANVALATQGETVPNEVLGSGRPAQASQSFTLHHSPLTYTRTWDGYGARGELKVEVNSGASRALRLGGGSALPDITGEQWMEIPSLALAPSWARVYAVSADEAGRATLRFGDGIHGARLPAGNENVTASYRFGAGAQGNVPAGSLIALRKRPPGIRSASNPVTATGGTDAESIDALRARAPRKLRCCGRIVTSADYEAFARDFPGIGQAHSALIDTIGETPKIWLTLVTEDRRPISQAPALRVALAAAIEANRADSLELRLEDPVTVTFDLELDIAVDPGADPGRVTRKVHAALAETFGGMRRDFGQAVDAQEVTDAVRAVPGVRSATLTALHRTGAAPAAGLGSIQPVEWLVINAGSGIVVTVQE